MRKHRRDHTEATNGWEVLSKGEKVKERLRTVTDERWRQKREPGPAWEHGKTWGGGGKREIQIRSGDEFPVLYQCEVSGLVNKSDDTDARLNEVYKETLSYFCLFSISLKLFQKHWGKNALRNPGASRMCQSLQRNIADARGDWGAGPVPGLLSVQPLCPSPAEQDEPRKPWLVSWPVFLLAGTPWPWFLLGAAC